MYPLRVPFHITTRYRCTRVIQNLGTLAHSNFCCLDLDHFNVLWKWSVCMQKLHSLLILFVSSNFIYLRSTSQPYFSKLRNSSPLGFALVFEVSLSLLFFEFVFVVWDRICMTVHSRFGLPFKHQERMVKCGIYFTTKLMILSNEVATNFNFAEFFLRLHQTSPD